MAARGFLAGDDLEKTRKIQRPSPNPDDPSERGRFWPDGTARIGGREYNGFLKSACYLEGDLSCLSCHSMHDSDPDNQIAARMDTNAACLQCHEDFANRIAGHTHHADDSAGSQCYNCHMPHTSHALLAAPRSHRIDSPNARTTFESGDRARAICVISTKR